MGEGTKTGAAEGSRSVLSEIKIEPAKDGDVVAIAALLQAAELPHEDFAAHIAHFLVARRENEIVGAIGAEVCGDDALLRSLVVASRWRGAGIGDALLRALEEKAAEWGVRRWWLLTTTAVKFFAQRRFRVTPRIEAPPAIAATAEFRELCPSVAVCLSRERRGE